MSFRAALLLTGMLAACTEPGEPQCGVAQTGGDVYVDVGRVASVTAGLSVSCFIPNVAVIDRPLRVVKEIQVEVLDPDNAPVAATASGPLRSGSNSVFTVSSTVQFTPDRPGPWTVIVRFEPNIGRSQQLVRTLDARTDAGMRALPNDLPAACTLYALTASGVPVCLLGKSSGDTELAIGGQRFEGSHFAVDGDDVWVMGTRRSTLPAGVDVLAPDDAGVYVPRHRYVFPVPPQEEPLFAAGGGVGYLANQSFGSQGVDRLDPDGDGGLRTSRVQIGSSRFPQAVVPADDRLMVLARNNLGASLELLSLLRDGGAEVLGVGAFAQPIGHSDGTFWAAGASPNAMGAPNEIVAWEPVNGTVRTGALQTDPQTGFFTVQRLSPQVPVVRVATGAGTTRVVLPLLGPSELGIEAFDLPAGYGEIFSATKRHAFARSTDGTKLLVIDR